LALALAAFLLSKVQFKEIAGAFRSLPLKTVVLGFLLYLLFNLAKAVRFSLLLRREISSLRLFPVMLIYSFWSNLLPMRAGDLTYLYMVRVGNGVALTRGISSLLVGSAVDATLNLTLLLTLGLYLMGEFKGAPSMVTLFVMPLILVVLLMGMLVALWIKGVKVAARLRAKKLAEFLEEIGRFRPSEILLGVIPSSAAALGLRFILQCYLVDGMGFGFGWLKVVFALAFTGFFNLIPIQSFAGLGTVEAPWSWALVSLGEEGGRAIAAGFTLHGIIIGYALICGGLGFPLRRLIGHGKVQAD
jgi:hypothetical protein